MNVLEKALFETLMAVMDNVWREEIALSNVAENTAELVEVQ